MIDLRNVLIILLSLAIASCAISKKENDRFENMNSGLTVTDNSLTEDSISHENLTHFEDRAMQKLIDFYDYLNILGYEDFNETIKDEVRSSAESLFFNAQFQIDPYSHPDSSELKPILEILQEEETVYPELDILNIEIMEGLKTAEEHHFVGMMRFDIRNKSASIIITKEARFSLRKIEKKFGDETVKVWEVFLETIE